LLGPFEEEEQEVCIASDEVKVKGRNLAIPDCLREDRVRR